jgi:hypothetical protein
VDTIYFVTVINRMKVKIKKDSGHATKI